MEAPSITHIIGQSLWNATNTVFGIFGLKPVYALYVVGALFVVGLCNQIYAAWKGRASWTFDPSKSPRKRTTE